MKKTNLKNRQKRTQHKVEKRGSFGQNNFIGDKFSGSIHIFFKQISS